MESQLTSISEKETVPSLSTPSSERMRWLETSVQFADELLDMRAQVKIWANTFPEEGAFHGFEREFLEKMDELIRGNLGWTITHNMDLPEWNEGDRALYICNHPTLTACWPWGWFMSKHFAHNMVAVAKDGFIKNPVSRFFLGGIMQTAEKAIFIPRKKDKRKEAFDIIKDRTARLLTPNTGVIILPDAHRPWPSRVSREQEKFDKKIPGLDAKTWMTDTCFPKSGGILALLEAIEEIEGVRLLDCTVVEPFPNHTFGGNMHIDVREICREDLLRHPGDVEYFQKKLIELWKRKNEIIRAVRGTS